MSRYRRSHVPGATYFFTVTVADRQSSALTDQIDRLRAVYRKVCAARPFETVAICILPNHLHAIWTLPEGDSDYARRRNLIKGGFSRGLQADIELSASKQAKREKGIWQRRYWEHQIRYETDMQRHADYIHFNPVKHGLARRVQDWPLSSFHLYVRRGWLSADWASAPVAESDFGE
jgi:putative transposase